MTDDFERDPETGQFLPGKGGAFRDPEFARQAGAKRLKAEQELDENLEALAELAGYQSAAALPKHMQLYAEEWLSGGARSVAAGREFVKLSGLQRRPETAGSYESIPDAYEAYGRYFPPDGMEACKLCGSFDWKVFRDSGLLSLIQDFVTYIAEPDNQPLAQQWLSSNLGEVAFVEK